MGEQKDSTTSDMHEALRAIAFAEQARQSIRDGRAPKPIGNTVDRDN